MFLKIPLILALFVLLLEVVHERLVECKDVFIFANKIYSRDLVLDNVPPEHGISDPDSL